MRGRGETRIIAVIVSGVPQTSHSIQLVGAAGQFPAADWHAPEQKERHSLTPLSSGKHLLSHSHTRKARPAHRRRELTLTPSHLCSAHLDSCPLHRDASDPTDSPLLGPHGLPGQCSHHGRRITPAPVPHPGQHSDLLGARGTQEKRSF